MAFWITGLRGALAIGLGVSLLFVPAKTLPMLGNFIGIYWLTSGIVALRYGVGGERAKGWALVIAVFGILAGLAMLSRLFAQHYVSMEILGRLMGLIILLTGLLHIFGGFRKDTVTRQRTWPSLLLGIFELALGLLMVMSPLGRGTAFYLSIGAWALLGGAFLIGDAMQLRRIRQQQAKMGNTISAE